MSLSGITRRIDELGRIVIPKEIRYNLGIRDGELLEVYVNDKNIVIRKYSQVENIKEDSQYVCDIISEIFNVDIMISDREKIVASSKSVKDLINSRLGDNHKVLIDNRETYIGEIKEIMFDKEGYYLILPIITSVDSSGLIFIVTNDKNNDSIKYAKMARALLVKKLDIA